LESIVIHFYFHLYPLINCRKTTNTFGTFRQIKDGRHQRREISSLVFETIDVCFESSNYSSSDAFLPQHPKCFLLLRRFPLFEDRCVTQDVIQKDVHHTRLHLFATFWVMSQKTQLITKDDASYAVTTSKTFLTFWGWMEL